MKTSGVKKTVMKTVRRRNTLKRLQAQLKSGKKPVKDKNIIIDTLGSKLTNNKLIDLSEKDIKRIEKEINTLKERI